MMTAIAQRTRAFPGPPFTAPNGSFYRVDTALFLPQVAPAQILIT